MSGGLELAPGQRARLSGACENQHLKAAGLAGYELLCALRGRLRGPASPKATWCRPQPSLRGQPRSGSSLYRLLTACLCLPSSVVRADYCNCSNKILIWSCRRMPVAVGVAALSAAGPAGPASMRSVALKTPSYTLLGLPIYQLLGAKGSKRHKCARFKRKQTFASKGLVREAALTQKTHLFLLVLRWSCRKIRRSWAKCWGKHKKKKREKCHGLSRNDKNGPPDGEVLPPWAVLLVADVVPRGRLARRGSARAGGRSPARA